MPPTATEREHVSFVGHHDLEGRPAFKIALQEVEGRWFCYLTGFWHSGWAVLDVTDPADPEHLRWVSGPKNTFTHQVQVADGLMVTSLEKPRRRGGVAGPRYDPADPYEEGALLWDVGSDPADPDLLGRYRTGGDGTHRNYYAGGDYAYMAAKPDDCEGRMLEVVDVSEPTNPEVVGRWWWPGQHENDPRDDEATYYFHGPAYVDGDRAFLSYGDKGMVVLDVSDPTDPERVTGLNVRDLGSWLGTHSAISVPGTDLVAMNSEAILEGSPCERDGEPMNYAFLVDVSDERAVGFDGKQATGPRIISSMPTPRPEPNQPFDSYHEKPGRFGPHNQHHYRNSDLRFRTDEYLVMTWFNAGLRVFDISEPSAPVEAGHFVAEAPDERRGDTRPESGLVSTFEDVVVDRRGYIYVTDPHHGLVVLESDLLSA